MVCGHAFFQFIQGQPFPQVEDPDLLLLILPVEGHGDERVILSRWQAVRSWPAW